MSLIKRTHTYIQRPEVYEIGRCPKNAKHQITWSEFENHLWCFACRVDFIPEHFGILDGPLPLGAARLMGISFDRINIVTGEITRFIPEDEAFDRDAYSATWAKGARRYTEAHE